MPTPIDEIENKAYEYDFFTLMRILEKSKQDGQWSDTRYFLDEKIKLRPDNKISFPGSDVASLSQLDSGKLELVVSFMGLYGVSSPLPSFFYEPITLNKDQFESLRHFLDLFCNRIYGLFYQSWKKYRHVVCFEKDGLDSYTKRLYNLVGRQWGLHRKMSVEEIAFELKLIPFSRLLSSRGRSAANLSKVLQGVFGFPNVIVHECVPKIVDNPNLSKLGKVVLSNNSILGTSMKDTWNHILIEIKDLRFEKWEALFEMEGDFSLRNQLQAVVEQFLNSPIEYTLVAKFVPPSQEFRSRLGETRLGWQTWLGKPQDDISVLLKS